MTEEGWCSKSTDESSKRPGRQFWNKMQRRQRKEDPESRVSSNGTILIKSGYWSVSVVKLRHEKQRMHAYLYLGAMTGKLMSVCLL